MSFSELATVFTWDWNKDEIEAARARGEHVVVLPKPAFWILPTDDETLQ